MTGVRSAAVIVATRQRSHMLRRCLSSLRAQAVAPVEVIVVDNSAGDAATREAAADFGATYLVEPRPGLAAARNTGARHAGADVVLFIDDDAAADQPWSAEMLSGFADATVGAVTGRVVPDAEWAAGVSGAAVAAGGAVFMPEHAFELSRADPNWFERAAFGGAGIGCNMGFRRKLFDSGFQFNERTGRGAAVEGSEEHLAFLRVLERDLTIRHVPAAVVRHSLAGSEHTIRRNHARDLASATGFMTLLLVEEAAFRRRTLRYMWDSARGVRRRWRVSRPGPPGGTRPISRGRAAVALAWGPVRYALWRGGMIGARADG